MNRCHVEKKFKRMEMKVRLLKKLYKRIEKFIKSNQYLLNMFSFRYNKERISNIGNLNEKRLKAHILTITMWNNLLFKHKRIQFEEKYRKYSRKYWTPKAIMERNLRGIDE